MSCFVGNIRARCYRAIACFLWMACCLPSAGNAAEPPPKPSVTTLTVDFKHALGQTKSVGEVLVKAADGGMLLLTPDGQLWTLQPSDIVSTEPGPATMEPISAEGLFADVEKDLPDGFLIHKTAHYVIVYNTSETYARWVGELYERLNRGFYNFWESHGIRLQEPRFPLVAYVFDSKAAYLAYAQRELGKAADAMIGYYNMQTNRIISFDLTGVEGFTRPGARLNSNLLINQVLAQPQAERTVATIVHEAVHQLSFNSSLQTRLADNPLWLSEGMAMFFEAPDVGNSRGWGTIGKVNTHNLRIFRQYLQQRPKESLATLITDDARFRKVESAADAYAESWALTYFLVKTKSKKYAAYVKEHSQFVPLGETEPRRRVELFKKHFGDDLEKLDQQFVSYMRNLRITARGGR